MPIFEYICQECQHEFETLVFGRDTRRLDWRASLQIPLAGIAAVQPQAGQLVEHPQGERRDVAAMVIATRVDPFASDRGRSGSSDGPSASHWDEDRSRGEPYGLGDAQGPA